MKPSFFIVGFQKSGTTTLYDALMSHPDVSPGLMKENNILAEPKDRLDEFKLCFPQNQKGKMTGDASHLHTWMPYGLERIKKYYPKAKIIVIMRNPSERAFSHFNMDQKIGYVPKNTSFRQLIDIELNLRRSLSDEAKMEDVYHNLKLYGNKYGWPLSRGLYHLYLEEMQKLELDFLPLFMEEMNESWEEAIAKVFEYVGVKPFELPAKVSNKGVYKSSLDDDLKAQLDDFYQIPNQKLAALLQRSLPW
ncbi:sulfotransferase [Salibacteraceae bacterium]|nr:sulfotransferase [Salibacteraceae bacterium]